MFHHHKLFFIFVYQRSHISQRGDISLQSYSESLQAKWHLCTNVGILHVDYSCFGCRKSFLKHARTLISTIFICFFTRTYNIMWFTCFNTCWSSVRVCYDTFAKYLKDISLFFFFFYILEIETLTWWELSRTKKNWSNTRHIHANPQFNIHIIHFIYLLFTFVHLNSQSSEDSSRENFTFSTILIFLFVLQELLAQNTKWAHVGRVWVVFLCEIFWQAVCRSMNL